LHANDKALPDPNLFTNTGAPKEQVNDRPLFVFGANKQADDAKEETATSDANKPNPELFTNTGTPKEQHREHAFNFFSKPAPQAPNNKTQAAAAINTNVDTSTNMTSGAAPAKPQTEPSKATEAAEDERLPDPALFTNPGTPKEQVRDRPFRLF